MDNKEAVGVFGIAGNFAGDKELVTELIACGESFLSPSANKPPLARLVSLLGSLPLKGRYAFVRKYLATSPNRDAILRDLFDYCFQQQDETTDQDGDVLMAEGGGAGNDDDTTSIISFQDEEFDEFVLIGNPLTANDGEGGGGATASEQQQQQQPTMTAPKPLNLKKFHIFQVVIVLMAVSGPAGAEMSRRYLTNSSSTKYRAKILVQLIECFTKEEISDDFLWNQYQISPRSIQDKIVDACKKISRKNNNSNNKRQRKDLLRRIYEHEGSDDRHRDLFYFLDTDYVVSKLLDNRFGELDRRLKHWGSHGDAYIVLLRNEMEKRKQDKLKQGKLWNHLVGLLELDSIQPRHLLELIKIWEEVEPSYIHYSAASDARKFLEARSAEGDDVRNFTNEIRRYDLAKEILERLSDKERLALAIKYYQARNWKNFDMVQRQFSSVVHRHLLPYKEFFANVSLDDIWTDKGWDPFLLYFWSNKLYSNANDQQKVEVFQAWSDMLLRSKPSLCDLSKPCGQNQGKTIKARWKWWYDNYCTFFQHMVFLYGSHDDGNESARFEKEAQQAQRILKAAMGAYDEVSTILEPEVAVAPILRLLQNVAYERCFKSKVAAANAVADECDRILTETVMPIYSQAIQFDPTKKTYVTRSSIGKFEGHISTLLSSWGSSVKIMEAISSAVLDLHDRASKNPQGSSRLVVTTANDDVDDESVPAAKRRKFVFFDHSLHTQARQKCFELAKRILKLVSDTKRPVEIDQAVTKQLWDLVRKKTLGDGNVGVYLEVCINNLPNHLRKDELPTIIEKSRASILKKFKDTPHRWKENSAPVANQLVKLGLLETVLEDEAIPKKVQDALLIDHAGFANEKARQSLKDATYVADGDARAEGITNWLSEACKTNSFDLIVEALEFAEGRIKNEAGPNRKTVFTWLEGHVVSEMVMRSLKAEKADLGTIESLCSVIISILRNDISRLDCVGRQVCFPRLPKVIVEKVLAFDPDVLCLEVRQLWVRCAIRLHWELQAASIGMESLACYSWPLPSHRNTIEYHGAEQFQLKSARWISKAAYQKLYPPSDTSKKQVKKPRNVDGLIRKELDVAKTFGPVQCVDLLTAALREVWSEDIPVAPLLQEGQRFPEKEEVADALRLRVESLFCLCGPAWQEVELLRELFDNIFKDIEGAPPSHISQARTLLGLFWHIHGEVGFAEVQRLANACDKVFRHAVASDERDVVSVWLPRWKSIYTSKGRRKWDIEVDTRLESFVHTNCIGCEPKAWRLVMSKTDEVERECSLARELLQLSSSALMLDYVRDTLFERRQDILLRYLKEGCELDGAFKSDDVALPESIDEILFDNVEEKQLLGCPAGVSRRYAQYVLAKATSSRCDLRSRIKAIGEFMSCPSTQPGDVLTALSNDMEEEAVREALINHVFSLDSPWHILGYLLSQKAIEKNDQRITSALLGYVSRHVPLEKVVLVVGHLLKKSRRKKLGFQLHKAAIRMLFDAETDEAMGFLRKEWEYELHESVRTLMIQKCIDKVVAGKVDGWEASVLMNVAESDTVEVDLKFCLFAPIWQGIRSQDFGTLAIKHPEDVLADDTFDLFRKKDLNRVSFDSVAVAELLRSVMEKLESKSEGSLQLLARLKKFSLSNLFGSEKKVEDDQGALNEMMSIITKPVDFADHKIQVERRLVSQMVAHAAIKLVKQQLSLRPSIPQKEVEDQCNAMEVTAMLRTCVRVQLDAALDLPIRKHIQRAVHLDSLQYLLSTVYVFVQNNNLSKHKLHHLLVVGPFEKELAILKKDEARINQALSTVSTTSSSYVYDSGDY